MSIGYEEEAELGRAARELLENPVLQRAFEVARARATQLWLGSTDPTGAASARDRHAGVDEVEGILRRFGAEGEYAGAMLRPPL